MKDKIPEAIAELGKGVYAALETYCNVHRGSGHKSMVTTYLFEQAREIVLEHLGLDKGRYVVIFCTPGRADVLMAKLKPDSYQCISSQDIGLPLGVRALAVVRKALPGGPPFQTGGGTTRLVSPGWVIWAHSPDRFEAGTPAIINIIAFAMALRLIRHFGNNAFRNITAEKLSAVEILYHDEMEEYSGKKLLDELRLTLIGHNVSVPTMEGTRYYINLDNAASTPTFVPIWNAVFRTWQQSGQVQQEIINEVRSICAKALGAPLTDYDVIFTSNTTEAINITAESLSNEYEKGTEPVILNTLLEHNSNDLPWRMVPGHLLIRLKVDAEGFIDLKEMDTILCAYNQKDQHGKKRIRIVAVSGASNVLGVFNNLPEISRIVHQYGARLLVDAAQLLAHRKVETERSGIDYLAFSAHKMYAPFGTGVLLVRKGMLNINPAEMELIQSSGEENAGGIAALGKALLLLQRIGLDLIQEEEQVLTGRILQGLSQVEGLTIYGIKDPYSPRYAHKGGVIAFSLKKMMADKVAKELAEQRGIGVRSGCHCSHMLVKYLVNVSPFLEKFQGLMLNVLPKISLPGIVRVSLGVHNSEEDVDTLIRILDIISRKNQTMGQRHVASADEGTSISPQTVVRKQMNDFVNSVAQKVYTEI
jgi:selenocysteine lyase/cysteine desulfurase